MATFQKVRVALATIAVLVGFSTSNNRAFSRTVSSTNGTITMPAGTRAGLQQVFAWDNRCRALPVSFSGQATTGNLFSASGVFRVLSGRCAGRKISGFTVVYKAPRGFKGTAKVNYTLKASNNINYFKFTRLMKIR
jgi:hypothetical protein